jgi:hypothetical protein
MHMLGEYVLSEPLPDDIDYAQVRDGQEKGTRPAVVNIKPILVDILEKPPPKKKANCLSVGSNEW